MNAGNPADRGGTDGAATPSDAGTEFLDVLRELKADGCNLLVVGDAPRRLFTETSGSLLGETDEARYRLLAVTDASPQSVAERLPTAQESPDSFGETTEIVDHAAPPRSIADVGERPFGDTAERHVVDPQLAGLQAKLAESMATFDRQAGGLDPAQLRVGVDSLGALFEHYDEDVVRRCLQVVTGYVGDYGAMGHYVLMDPYESQRVQSLAELFDAVIELRVVDPAKHDHDAEERWHVSDRDLTTGWFPI